ncbi:MAG TPA: hypothetical protein VN838_26645 [Bradyrhizobium sp.]|nr:hypothetical protein [Bradyrhizobium sp.]
MRTFVHKAPHMAEAFHPVHRQPRMLQTHDKAIPGDTASSEAARWGYDFSRIPIYPRAEIAEAGHYAPPSAKDKSLDANGDDDGGIVVHDQSPDAGTPDAGTKGGAAPVAPVAAKKAGVQSFEVKWTENPAMSATNARVRLDYTVKFKKDAAFDPALAEFRQNAFHKLEVTAGPHKGLKDDNSPLHDDNYSRADDTAGNAKTDTNFVCNDNPGASGLDKDDVLDYSFTAEQMIIDTSDANKQIEKKGPHTVTIKGKHLRTVTGVPKTF